MLKTIWNGINKVYVRYNHANRNKSSVMTILPFTFFNPKLQDAIHCLKALMTMFFIYYANMRYDLK